MEAREARRHPSHTSSSWGSPAGQRSARVPALAQSWGLGTHPLPELHPSTHGRGGEAVGAGRQGSPEMPRGPPGPKSPFVHLKDQKPRGPAPPGPRHPDLGFWRCGGPGLDHPRVQSTLC